jgi:cytochrome c oxidase assembly protein Cox11
MWRDRVLIMTYAQVPLFGVVCVVALFKGMVWCCGGKKDKYDSMA